jgi:capsular exopolysaccharide synthesis family protein
MQTGQNFPLENQVYQSDSIEQNLNLRHYWHIVLERRWLVMTAFFTIMLLTAIYLYRATPIYSASARIQIDRESGNPLNFRDALSLETREQDYLQTQYKNLQSRTLIQSVISDLKLDRDPRYAQKLDKVEAVAKDISIVPIRLSRLVDVRVEHPNPKTATEIANKLAKNFIEQNLQQKVGSSSDALMWLRSQVDGAKVKVQDSENQLNTYQKDHNEVSLEEGENIVRQALIQAQTEVSKVRAESAQAQEEVAEIDRLVKNGEPNDTIPAVAQNLTVQHIKQEIDIESANLAQLLKKYREKYPTVIAARSRLKQLQDNFAEECENQLKTIHNRATILKKQEEKLISFVQEEEQKQLRLNSLKITYDMLKSDAVNNKAVYSNVLVRMKETELMSRMNSNNMRIVDDAVEGIRPVKPRTTLTILGGLIGGMLVAVGLAFFVNYLDDSLKSQDDIETHLRVPFLGYIPNIKTNSVVERDLQAHLHPQSNAAEGFRTIRATIALTHKPEKFRVLAITSTIPSEGKSLVASNLAIVHAQTGLRTLLVDADLRRPSVHKAYQLHSPTGLSAYLTKESNDLEGLIHTTEVPNLDVVCCGSVPTNPSELIGSPRMLDFLEKAKDRYDRILLDCPPVSAVSDPLIIAAMSDGVVYVTKFNKIRREHGIKSVQRIQNSGIHILGVVINDIDFEGKDSYYYSYYYYQNRYYSSHYKSAPSPQPTPVAKDKSKKGEKLPV